MFQIIKSIVQARISTPALNTCARNGIDANGDGQYDDVNGDGIVNSSDFYQYNGNLTVFDIGANSITFDGTSSITLSRASSDPNTAQYYMYETMGGMDASLMPDNAFYDLNITSCVLWIYLMGCFSIRILNEIKDDHTYGAARGRRSGLICF